MIKTDLAQNGYRPCPICPSRWPFSRPNRILIDTGNQRKSGLFDVSLSGEVDAVMYKSRLYTKLRI